jgi:tetratricopeptide (TPR) repeat protein
MAEDRACGPRGRLCRARNGKCPRQLRSAAAAVEITRTSRQTNPVLGKQRARLLPRAALVLLGAIVAIALWLLFSFRHQGWAAQTIEAAVAVVVAAGGFVNWLSSKTPRDPEAAGDGTVAGLPVAVPTGELPQVVRGRDGLIQQLHKVLRRPDQGPAVLTGVGGAGKSTVAIVFAEICQRPRFGRRQRYVWWISAADQSSLTGGLVTAARQLGAGHADLEVIRAGGPDGPERLWQLLHDSGRRWLLVFDNADDPAVLAAPRAAASPEAGPADHHRALAGTGTGWMRSSRRGLVIVTTRVDDRAVWGRNAQLLTVGRLDDEHAAQLLLDLAPQAGNASDARKLADRLGGLPLPLRIAGLRLGSVASQRQTFDEYARTLDDPGHRPRMLSATVGFGMPDEPRYVVMRTWELSLDDLARLGVPQARPLLRVLSCFAAPIPVPRWILTSPSLNRLLTAGPAAQNMSAEDRLDDALRGLQMRGLIEIRPFDQQHAAEQGIVVQSVIADTNRTHLADGADGKRETALVRQAAIEIMLGALKDLNPDQNDDWPTYLALGPHLHALYGTVARHVRPQQLEALVSATVIVARAHNFMGDIPEGERLCRAARSMADLLGADNTAVLRAGKELAWVLAAQEQWPEAETLYREVLAAFEHTLGHDNPNTITTRHELAWVAGCQQRWPEAEAGYREVLDARTRVLGPEDRATLVTRHELAWAIENQEGREREAQRILEDVLNTRQRVLSQRDRRILLTRRELAWITAKLGDDPEESVTEYQNILASFRSDFGAEHPETLTTWEELAWALALASRSRAALRQYRNVLRAREQVLGRSHPRTAATRQALDMLRDGNVLTPLHIV